MKKRLAIGFLLAVITTLVGANIALAAPADSPECQYDTNGSGVIDYSEYKQAVIDYLHNRLDSGTFVAVATAYRSGASFACGEEETITRTSVRNGNQVTMTVTVPRGTFESFYAVKEIIPDGARVVDHTADNWISGWNGGEVFIMLGTRPNFTYTLEGVQAGGEISGLAWDGLTQEVMPVTSIP